jgi:hypothetical protein
MSTALAALVLVALGQVQADPAAQARVKAIAPFVESDVFAVIQVDVAKLDVAKLLVKVFGDAPPPMPAEGKKTLLRWCEGLKAAGAKELYVVFSIIDMPGGPFVVVPLPEGARALEIAKTMEADPAPIQNAIVLASPEARARLGRAPAPAPARPELSAAFGAVGQESVSVRLLLLPSADSRRVLEEMMPRFPQELGGGPITDFTRGLNWAAAGIDEAEKPALRMVAGSRDAESARSLVQLMEKVVGFLRVSPEVAGSVPGLAKLLPEFKPVLAGDRVTLDIDARQAGAIFDAGAAPAIVAATRTECTNNEKQIVLAFHNYHNRHGSFPPAFSQSKDGKPLLSWRVLILPFLDQQALYKQFHLDEAWDSPHNRTLIAKMPASLRCPAEKEGLGAEGKTRYLAPRGVNTVLRGAEPVSLRDITDGTSNTIIVIDAGDDHAVVWTKPEDWQFDPEPGIESIFRSHAPGGIVAAFADGSVRYLSQTIAPAVLRALLSRNGGEVINRADL